MTDEVMSRIKAISSTSLSEKTRVNILNQGPRPVKPEDIAIFMSMKDFESIYKPLDKRKTRRQSKISVRVLHYFDGALQDLQAFKQAMSSMVQTNAHTASILGSL